MKPAFSPFRVSTTSKGTFVFMDRTIKKGRKEVEEEIVIWDKNNNKKLDTADRILTVGNKVRNVTTGEVKKYGVGIKKIIAKAVKHREALKKSVKPFRNGICFPGPGLQPPDRPFSPPLALSMMRMPKNKRYISAHKMKGLKTYDPRKCNMASAWTEIALSGTKVSVDVWMSGPWNIFQFRAFGVTCNPNAVQVTYFIKSVRYIHVDMHK